MDFLSPARTRLPDESSVDFAKPDEVKAYIASLNAALTSALQQRAPKDTAQAGLLMLSPNGASYRLAVTDAGAVTATKLKDPP